MDKETNTTHTFTIVVKHVQLVEVEAATEEEALAHIQSQLPNRGYYELEVCKEANNE